jgi:hypothetical protein
MPAAQTQPNYTCSLAWACHPGNPVTDDVCRGDLSATEVLLDGSLRVVPFSRDPSPTFDCFYV